MVKPTPRTILKDVFGYDTFRPLQQEVIANILQRRDTLVIMPTGGGKSLCYQIPALLFDGLTVVVSPLIALMKDQVEQLQAVGAPALFLNSSLSHKEYQHNMAEVQSGRVKLLYVAPETLLTGRLFGLLEQAQLDCLTIDEAHCISEWGHDFRPEYRQLAEVRGRFPQAVCLALTATATPRVRQDIRSTLRFERSNEFTASFNRPNLHIKVTPRNKPRTQLLQFLQDHGRQSGIIYCFSRRQVDELSAFLEQKDFLVRPYHAGLDDNERQQNQEAFIHDDVHIIVATIAFGMGINKPDVRFVVHYDLPKSIENYYQEIGRAGRDGLPADCLLLYSYGDAAKLRYFIDQKAPNERQVAYQHLEALTRYAESDVCRRGPLLAYFGETYSTENCAMCDNCLNAARQQVDITIATQKLLSCALRTGEIFGASHLVDVLLGSKNQKVRKFNHDALSTYGIGRELTREQWFHISRQLLQKGLLSKDGQYGSLTLTPLGRETLMNRQPVSGVLQTVEPDTGAQDHAPRPHDPALFDLLRRKRKTMADEAGVPPYVIFPDRTLIEMATFFPQSIASLRHMNGVGQVKAARYGRIFVDLLADYCQEHQITEQLKIDASDEDEPGVEKKQRFEEVGESYNQGSTIDALMAHYQVKQRTIIDHLSRYALNGHALRAGQDLLSLSALPAERQQTVLAVFEKLGTDILRPVFEALEETVSYDELRLLRLQCLARAADNRDIP